MSQSSASQAIAATLDALPGFPVLRGARVSLRGPTPDDSDALFALFSSPDVMRYWSRPPMTERAEAQSLVANILEGFKARTTLNWVIADAHGHAIGSCTLFRFDANHRRAELGYALQPAYWGQGIAAEAATLALDWAFDTLKVHRVDAGIDPDNSASRRLLHRLGFRTEGRQRESFFVGDRVTDSELLGLLASDWRARTR